MEFRYRGRLIRDRFNALEDDPGSSVLNPCRVGGRFSAFLPVSRSFALPFPLSKTIVGSNSSKFFV